MAMIVALWALITLCSASYTPMSAALQALKNFRALAMGSIYASVLAAIAVTALLYFHSPEATLVGILMAELFLAVFMLRVVMKSMRGVGQ